MTTEPNDVDIDVSEVPLDKRTDPRFLSLLADMRRGCADPRLVHQICVHEAAHAFFLGHAGMTEPSANRPKILYDSVKDEFNGQGSTVKFGAMDKRHVASIDSREWLGRVAKGYAAGGVAARVLSNAIDTGDGNDRDNFNAIFAKIKSDNPAMTWTADYLWTEAQRAVRADLQHSEIKKLILDTAEGLKPELFRASSTNDSSEVHKDKQ